MMELPRTTPGERQVLHDEFGFFAPACILSGTVNLKITAC